LLSHCRRSSRQEEGREGGRKGGRKGGGEGGEDVGVIEVVMKAVGGEEEEVTGLGTEGQELAEFRTVAEGGREGGKEGRVRVRAQTPI